MLPDLIDSEAAPTPLERAMGMGSIYFALTVAWTAMVGSLYFSEVRHFVPCAMCWYQRILMYPLAAILAIGLLRRDANLPYYVLPISLLGIATSTYHYLLQKTDWFQTSTACQAGVPCSVQYINVFGFVTIPFLALTAFLLITLATSAARRDIAMWAGPGPTPWPAVASTVAAVLVFFAVLRATVG